MKKLNKQAFTLVELIVVVAILAVLASIGFVSYSGYISGVRDTNRMSQLSKISDGLELHKIKRTLPIPENKIDIEIAGELIGYQGYMGKSNLEIIEYNQEGKDPKDDSYFSYYLTENKKYYQLMAFLEDEENLTIGSVFKTMVPQTYASIDYTNRHPKVVGDKLGILTDENNTPIQEISSLVSSGSFDVATTTDEYKAHIQDNSEVSGTGGKLVVGIVSKLVGERYKSCKDILENKPLSSGVDGAYIINPTGLDPFQVYCDMTTSSGAYTLILNKNYVELDSDLVGYWDMETTLNGDLKDFSQYENHGVLFGGMSIGTEILYIGKASYFDGSNDYINLGKVFSGSINSFSMSSFIRIDKINKRESCPGDPNVFTPILSSRNTYGGGSNEQGIRHGINNNCSGTTRWSNRINNITGTSLDYDLTNYSSFEDKYLNESFHISLVFDEGEVSFYINGLKVASKPSSPITSLLDGRDNMFMGRTNVNTGFFKGIIDEVRIYKRALSDSEVGAIYNTLQ